VTKPSVRVPHTEGAWSHAVIVRPDAIGMLLADPTSAAASERKA